MQCKKCQNEIPDDSIFCPVCGQQVNYTPQRKTPQRRGRYLPHGGTPERQRVTKRRNLLVKLGLLFISIALVAAIVLLTFFSPKSIMGSKPICVYMRDRELFYEDLNNRTALQLSTDLIQTDDFENDQVITAHYVLSGATILSEDGTKIIYPDKCGVTGSIYYRDLNQPDAQPIKITSDVEIYTANHTLDKIIYLSEDGNLYRHDLQKKDKLASDVSWFRCSEDTSIVYYRTDDDELYVINADGKKDKIDSGITKVVAISDDYKTIYHIKEESVYVTTLGSTRVRIASNVSSAFSSGENELFYLEPAEQIPLKDLIRNDTGKADWESDFDTTYSLPGSVLAYYDGHDLTTLSETASILCQQEVNGKLMLCYCEYDFSNMSDIALSKINQLQHENGSTLATCAYMLINKALDDCRTYYVVIDGKPTELPVDLVDYVWISASGESLYYIDSEGTHSTQGDLYKLQISKGSISSPSLVESDVSYYGIRYSADYDTLLYYKDGYGGKADIYMNGTAVGYDVYYLSLRYIQETHTLYFISDWNEEKMYGTLYYYDGSKTVKVADDVNSFTVTPDGSLLYLYDYSSKFYRGDLYLYQGGESVLLENDVETLIDLHKITERQYSGPDIYA